MVIHSRLIATRLLISRTLSMMQHTCSPACFPFRRTLRMMERTLFHSLLVKSIPYPSAAAAPQQPQLLPRWCAGQRSRAECTRKSTRGEVCCCFCVIFCVVFSVCVFLCVCVHVCMLCFYFCIFLFVLLSFVLFAFFGPTRTLCLFWVKL